MSNRYAPPIAPVADPHAAVTYAGFWWRVAAVMIDVVLLLVILTPLLLWIYGVDAYLDEEAPFIKGPADVLLSWVLPAAATLIFWKYRQATPGKMMLRLKIVDAKSLGKLSTGQVIGRYFAYIPAIVVGFLGLLWVAWDARKQGWHDKLAGTVVIRT